MCGNCIYLFVVNQMTLTVAHTTQRRAKGYVNEELERMWKKAVACLRYIPAFAWKN
jgi:hypothetical protein